ncbi:MAG: hypothetical protein C5B53_06675 [Candidatus Melainabacteria bacterium]|nr:MAG: hypothetical protein C5B53_06675 [Candidatus Melainabacteria bacterium]
MHKRTQLCGLLSTLLGLAFSIPVFADEITSELTPNLDAKYKQRISDMKDQLDKGVSKGWISGAKADGFKQELSDVDALETDISAKGFPKEPTNDLEKKVTLLNQRITSAMSGK